MANIANLMVTIGANTSNLEKGLKRTESSTKKIARALAGVVSVGAIIATGKKVVELAQAQENAEKRLETIMTDVTGASKDQIDSMKRLASEMQKVTTIGDEVNITGMSQLATFNLQTDTIETLTKGMDDLAVATYGTEVNQDQMTQTANLLGKVMQGQVGALSRVGVSFTDAQAKILKTGTEMEKAAVLSEVLQGNFGDLAEEMAKTSEGQIVQMQNALGDLGETVGEWLIPYIMEFVEYINEHMPEIQSAVETAMDKASQAIQWGIDHWEGIKTSAELFFTFLVSAKVTTAVSSVVTSIGAITTAIGVSSAGTGASGAMAGMFALNPYALGIGVLIAALVLIATHTDEITESANKASRSLANVTGTTKNVSLGAGVGVGGSVALAPMLSLNQGTPSYVGGGYNPAGYSLGRPAAAMGTSYAPGGQTLVGEHGPELVNLPRGSKVSPNYETESMVGGGITINIQNANIREEADIDKLAKRLSFYQRQRSLGGLSYGG